MKKSSFNPFLVQRQMMSVIKRLPKEKKKLLAEYQLRFVDDFAKFPVEALKRKYDVEVQ